MYEFNIIKMLLESCFDNPQDDMHPIIPGIVGTLLGAVLLGPWATQFWNSNWVQTKIVRKYIRSTTDVEARNIDHRSNQELRKRVQQLEMRNWRLEEENMHMSTELGRGQSRMSDDEWHAGATQSQLC
ncbi:uncharacterized protein LTR77_003574 [Saxophila tyrrhenica]|uniref:Uncharacterized protein n=1 Tax=Saxophila tyrrhenica TaxID=1690608 RepID=A0AAV9PFD4_9PEZI|nr:hypothetical protein LTR77_003574 [Saxophila tyrrhenica]